MKIFNLSLHRTGTQSFIDYTKENGYKCQHWPGKNFDVSCTPALENLDYNYVYKLYSYWIESSDCFGDLPMPIISYDLIRDYPNAKFCLFMRDPNSWLASARMHVNKRGCDVLEKLQYSLLTGCARNHIRDYSDSELIEGYLNFHTNLINTLHDYNRSFILLNLSDTKLKEKLDDFLSIDSEINFGRVDITK